MKRKSEGSRLFRKPKEKAKEKGKVLDFKPPEVIPNLAELVEAFEKVFPNEKMRDAAFTVEAERTIFTIHSDLPPTRMIKTRTYALYAGQTYLEILQNTPELD